MSWHGFYGLMQWFFCMETVSALSWSLSLLWLTHIWYPLQRGWPTFLSPSPLRSSVFLVCEFIWCRKVSRVGSGQQGKRCLGICQLCCPFLNTREPCLVEWCIGSCYFVMDMLYAVVFTFQTEFFICVASTALEMRKSYFECNIHLPLKKCLFLPGFFMVSLEILFCWAESAIVYVVMCLQNRVLCMHDGRMPACLMKDWFPWACKSC